MIISYIFIKPNVFDPLFPCLELIPILILENLITKQTNKKKKEFTLSNTLPPLQTQS